MNKKETLKKQILQLSREYYDEVHRNLKVFEPGKSFVNYGGRFFDAEELVNLIDSSLDFWLTAGPWAHKFEKRFADWLGIKYCSLTNSGSSANLLAFMTLTSPLLGERRIKKVISFHIAYRLSFQIVDGFCKSHLEPNPYYYNTNCLRFQHE